MTLPRSLAALAVFSILPPLNAAEKDNKSDQVTMVQGNLTLDRAVALAVRQNPEILRAEKEIERTRGQVLEVRAQALPHVDLTGSYSQTDPNLLERSSGGNGASFQAMGPNGQTTNVNINNTQLNNSGGDKSWRIAIEARQLLYSGGQVRAALEIAKYTEDQSIYTMRETVDRIIAQTRNQFYLVLLNRQLIKVAEENIGLLADELKDQRNRFDAGTVPKFNVLRAEVALANAQPDLVRAKNAYLIAQLELAKTLGLAASRGPTAKPSFEVVGELRLSERNQNQAEAMATARELRPFLRAQRQSILIEEQQITVARAGYKPRLEATGGYEARNSRLSDDLGEVVNGWTFGVDGTWAVFDGFETKGKIQQAQARLAAAKITYEDSVRQVELEVQQALARLGEARELIVGQGKVVEQATEALRLARERLAAGAGTQLDVLDAQVELTKARTTQQQALYDYNTAAAEFDRATGTQTIYQEPGMPVRTVKSVKPVKVEPAPKKKGKK